MGILKVHMEGSLETRIVNSDNVRYFVFVIFTLNKLSPAIAQYFLEECTGIGFEIPFGSYSLDVCLKSRN